MLKKWTYEVPTLISVGVGDLLHGDGSIGECLDAAYEEEENCNGSETSAW